MEDRIQIMPPDRRQVVRVIKGLQALMFPMCFRREDPDMADEQLREATMVLLYTEVCAAMRFRAEDGSLSLSLSMYNGIGIS